MIRGSPAVVILPNNVLVNVVFGLPTKPNPLICCVTPGPTWLNRLNASRRNSNCWLPDTVNRRLATMRMLLADEEKFRPDAFAVELAAMRGLAAAQKRGNP